jgi:hypothetical protein
MMSWKNYGISCLAVAILTAAIILLVPGLAEALEVRLLTFLSTNASG